MGLVHTDSDLLQSLRDKLIDAENRSESALQSAEMEVSKTRTQLEESIHHWEQVLRRCQDSSCEDTTKSKLRLLREHGRRVEADARRFKSSSRTFILCLETSIWTLNRLLATLERYWRIASGGNYAQVGSHKAIGKMSNASLLGGEDGAAEGSWWNASNFGENWPGTIVPRGFDLEVGGQKYFVHPNATKHMAEYVVGIAKREVRAYGDFPISSLAGAVEHAHVVGLQPGRNFVKAVKTGDWELGIDTIGKVIFHALYKP